MIWGNDTLFNILMWLALGLSLFVGILGIGLFVMWIKYSWMNQHNSMNYTGKDLTQKMFQKYGVNAEIKSSFFYSKYWNHNERRNTYKLRPWTHDRQSLWTMMEASQQAYATIIRKTNKRDFWAAFRLPQLVGWIGGLLGMALVVWAFYGLEKLDINSNGDWQFWVKVSLGFSVTFTAVAFSVVRRAYLLKKNVVPMIADMGFQESELRVIQQIFNWAYIYAWANAILQLIRMVMDIYMKTQERR